MAKGILCWPKVIANGIFHDVNKKSGMEAYIANLHVKSIDSWPIVLTYLYLLI